MFCVVEITSPLEFILQIIWLHSKWITGSSREQEFQPQHEFTSLFSQPWGHLERWRRGLDFLLLLLLLCRRSHAIRRTTMCASGVTSCSLFLYNFLSKRATRAKGQVSPWRFPREGQGWNITFIALWYCFLSLLFFYELWIIMMTWFALQAEKVSSHHHDGMHRLSNAKPFTFTVPFFQRLLLTL